LYVKTLCKNYLFLLNEKGSDLFFLSCFSNVYETQLRQGLGEISLDLSDYEFCMYSTRKSWISSLNMLIRI
jgi:hypothetical protein